LNVLWPNILRGSFVSAGTTQNCIVKVGLPDAIANEASILKYLAATSQASFRPSGCIFLHDSSQSPLKSYLVLDRVFWVQRETT
jgi:hypothetical protein